MKLIYKNDLFLGKKVRKLGENNEIQKQCQLDQKKLTPKDLFGLEFGSPLSL